MVHGAKKVKKHWFRFMKCFVFFKEIEKLHQSMCIKNRFLSSFAVDEIMFICVVLFVDLSTYSNIFNLQEEASHHLTPEPASTIQ